LISYI